MSALTADIRTNLRPVGLRLTTVDAEGLNATAPPRMLLVLGKIVKEFVGQTTDGSSVTASTRSSRRVDSSQG